MRWPILTLTLRRVNGMEKLLHGFFIILALVLVSGCLSGSGTNTPEKTCEQAISEIPEIILSAQNSQTAEVTRVVDGDTVELADDSKVRFIGINTPEKEENYYTEAKENLENLVLDQQVFLTKDVSNTDKYGRKLRYVFTEDKFVNAEQVSAGLASSFEYPPDTKYQFLFNCLETEAKDAGLGIWKGLGLYDFTVEINQNPDDVSEPSLESVVLTNLGYNVNMDGWQMKDEATHIYTFSNTELDKGESVTIVSGEGTDSADKLYWNLKTTVWNNDGDTVFLRDAEGNLAIAYSY